jgi:hypothetical protein
MKVQSKGFFRGMAIGLALGVSIGSIGLAYAGIMKDGWEKQSDQFKLGYIAGFKDVLVMAKGTSPSSYLDQQYKVPPRERLIDWLAAVNRAWADEKNADSSIQRVMAIASVDMNEQFGPERSGGVWMKGLGEAIQRRRDQIARGEIKPTPPEVLEKRRAQAAIAEEKEKCARKCRKNCRASCRQKPIASSDAPASRPAEGGPEKTSAE